MVNFSLLLPLKGRERCTKRILRDLNKKKCPYEILILDGGDNKGIENWLLNGKNLPNLQYEYNRYPYDEDFECFYKKMSNGLDKVKTSLVSVIDNDDFIDLDGIQKCIKMLENKSFSSARGAILQNNKNIYHKFPNSIIKNTSQERLKDQTLRWGGNWHNVSRTKHMKAVWQLIEIINPTNFRFVEQITGYLLALWGDSYRGNFPFIIRGKGGRIKISSGTLSDHFPSQEEWIKADYWPSEFNKMVEVISASISYFDNISIKNSIDFFCKTYPLKLPHLQDLLIMRIKEASLLGYDYEKINKMQIILKDLKI
tara:strand:+ start:358 stop:1293 length:936 start_codon:yes stop_codon:yes gene_type:complete